MNTKFSKTVVKKTIDIKSLYTIHYQALNKNYVSKSESHDFWEINYADKENVEVVVAEKKEVLSQGEMILIPPSLPHRIITGDKEPNVFIISFECKNAELYSLANKKIAVGKKDRVLLQDIMSEAEHTFEIPEFDPDLNILPIKRNANLGGVQCVATLLELFIIKVLRAKQNNTDTDTDRFIISADDETLKSKIIAFLSSKLYSEFSLEDLCIHLHYNKSWLSSYFYAETGTTIYKTYIKMKMNEAKRLIRQKYSFTEIAEKLCFDNPFYFSAAFKKQVGMTPSEYRNSIK